MADALPTWLIDVLVTEGQIAIRAEANRARGPVHTWMGADVQELLRTLELWLMSTPQARFVVTVKSGTRAWCTTATHWRVAVYFVVALFEREFVGDRHPRLKPRLGVAENSKADVKSRASSEHTQARISTVIAKGTERNVTPLRRRRGSGERDD